MHRHHACEVTRCEVTLAGEAQLVPTPNHPTTPAPPIRVIHTFAACQ